MTFESLCSTDHTMSENKAPSVLLLGAGYTLQRLATRLVAGKCLLTSRSDVTAAQFRSEGLEASVLNICNWEDLWELLQAHPSIDTIVDSVPPIIDRNVGQSDSGGLEETAIRGVRNVCRAAKR